MKHAKIASQKGFAALIPSVLISALLMVLAASVARDAFWTRFNLLARENKNISLAAAEGCANLALLKIAKNDEFSVLGQCEAVEISGSGPYEITVRSVWKSSYTNLKVTAKFEEGKISIIDWREY